MDADVHLDWNCVLQILASAQSQSASCPICLSTPSAPRMAKCGHIFCLPCLIRYMHSTDDTIPHPEKKARWKKCPICWDSVYISETRPVRWFTGQEGEAPREGGDVVLRLMSRMVGSTLALPRDGAESLERVDDIPWFFAAEVMDYARVMKGNEDYMTAQYNAELIDLQRQEREDELMFGEDTMWTQKAISAILEARGKLKGMGGSPYASKQSIEKSPKRIPLRFREPTEAGPDYNFIQHVAKAGQSLPLEVHTSYSGEPFSNQTLEKNAMTAMLDDENIPKYSEPAESSKSDVSQSTMKAKDRDKNPTTSQLKGRSEGSCHQVLNDSPFYFYEALLHYYLSPLDIRILKAAFGDFSSFPTTVLPRVERVSTGHIIDDELRRRAKYLAHLPHGCEVGFLECDWTDIVSAEVLDSFSVEICRRRKKNREKELREEKERIRAEKEEDDKRWAAARRKRPTSTQETMMSAEFQALPLLEDGSDNSPSIEIATGSSPPWGSSRTHPGSAFASLASPSTSPAASRTVWGTTAIAPTSPVISTKAIEPDPSVNDGWLPNWERDLLQEDELNADFEVSPVGGIISKVGAASANSKRKKGKKITLMTTNARRGA